MYEIVAIRTHASDDRSHEHIALVGYRSPHMPDEAIMIAIPRVVSRIALGEAFGVTVGDDKAEVSAGTCASCGHEPYLKTAKDTADRALLLTLPRK